jgi:hypothetical protein
MAVAGRYHCIIFYLDIIVPLVGFELSALQHCHGRPFGRLI